MSSRKKPSTVREVIQGVINDARVGLDHPNSSPAITQKVMGKGGRHRLRVLERNREARRHLMGIGFNYETRLFLKGTDDEKNRERGVSQRQLNLWPEHLRAIVQDIDCARVYVPSIKEFVPVEPDQISKEQTNEAGEYLIKMGEETVRVGRQLVELARAR